MAFSTTIFVSFHLLLQISNQVLCFPSPDLSHLHHFDAAFDLVQEESRFQPTAIVPPPAELIIREKFSLPTTVEETQEPSYLRPVTVRNLAYTSPPPRKSSQALIYYEPKFEQKSIPGPIVAPPQRAQVIQISPSLAPIPTPQVFRESITTTTRPPPIVHHRRDDDSTQAFGVLENAALSLQDDDQLALNLTGNCSADIQVEYPEKPILKPHELEDGVIADAKKLAVVASIETFNYRNPVERPTHEDNQLNFNTEFIAEFPQGSENLLVLEEPDNSTHEQCNDTDTALPTEQAELEEIGTSTTVQYEHPTTTLPTVEEATDVSPPPAAHAQETSPAPSGEALTEGEATSVLPAPLPTEALDQVEEGPAPSVTETVTILSSPAPSVPEILNLSASTILVPEFEDAALLPSLPIQTDDQPSVVKRPGAIEAESAEQTAVVETTAPSVSNNSLAIGEGSETPSGSDSISGEDGQVYEGTILKHGASYNIKNVAESLCLTAHKHRFLDAGILPGSVTTETFEREDNQIWDALETGPNEYWLMTQRYTVNEVTSVLTDEPVPPKNFFKIIPISSRTFIMKSTVFDKCIESVGMHKRISFVPCDITIVEQHWTAEYLYEEQKADLK